MVFAGRGAVDYRMLTVGGEGDWSRWARGLGGEVGVVDLFGSPLKFPSSIRQLVAEVRAFRPDIVYAVGLRASLAARIARVLLGRRLFFAIVHAIRTTFPRGSAMRRKFAVGERLMRSGTAHYVANSKAGAAGICELAGVGPGSISVIYNGVSAGGPISAGFRERPERVVVVANITGEKGHFEFLDVVAQLASVRPRLEVVFVGRNDIGDRLASEIQRFGLSDIVRVAGYQAAPEAVMQLARVFALPTLTVEGCPTSIIEAMSLGLPVVAYAVGGIPELVEPGVTGFLVEPGCVADFANALDQLLGDEALNSRLGQAARTAARERYSLHRCADDHTKLWERLRSA